MMPIAGPSARFTSAILRATALVALWLGASMSARADDFDFYVLSLSWSPSYCATEGSRADQAECGRPFGFIVHGLWPQYERGYPESCATDARPPDATVYFRIADIMPGRGLARHEWQKHGTCSGLSGNAYFDLVRKARDAIRIPGAYVRPAKTLQVSPQAVESAFVTTNTGLPRNAIAVTCRGALLREVRICMTRDLKFRACDEVDRNSCRRPLVAMPSVD
jgi:ribonuclease T2